MSKKKYVDVWNVCVAVINFLVHSKEQDKFNGKVSKITEVKYKNYNRDIVSFSKIFVMI